MSASFYNHFGMLAVSFAHLEADIRVLVAGIAFDDDSIAAAAFLDGSTFSANLRILKDLSRQFPDAEDQFAEIVRRSDKLRRTRNLFIHGVWSARTYGRESGRALVETLKTTYSEGHAGRKWTHGDRQEFAEADFADLLTGVNEVIERVHRLCMWLEKHEDKEFSRWGATLQSKAVVVDVSNLSGEPGATDNPDSAQRLREDH